VSTDPFRGLDSRPTGFGTCGGCPYREAGSVEICYPCARQTMRALPSSRCSVCEQEWNPPRVRCSNRVCHWPNRQFHWNAAVAMRDGALEHLINRYKYNGRTGWSLIFGRVLAGFLHDQRERFAEFDLVTASPTYVGLEPQSTPPHPAASLRRARSSVAQPRRTRSTSSMPPSAWATRATCRRTVVGDDAGAERGQRRGDGLLKIGFDALHHDLLPSDSGSPAGTRSA
jgi:hypothetical protein